MKVEDIFVKCLLTETIKIRPSDMHKEYMTRIRTLLTEKVEGKCTNHGYIKRGSVEIIRVNMGQVESQTFHGYVTFVVKFRCEVCNPSIGMVVSGSVSSMNQLGLLCVCSYKDTDTHIDVPVLHVYILNKAVTIKSDINLSDVKTNDVVSIQILGKKYVLNDSKLMAVGKIVKVSRIGISESAVIGEGEGDEEKEGEEGEEEGKGEDDDDMTGAVDDLYDSAEEGEGEGEGEEGEEGKEEEEENDDENHHDDDDETDEANVTSIHNRDAVDVEDEEEVDEEDVDVSGDSDNEDEELNIDD
jgi:DNA-directed RNA polymerase subunit E'/Rpb7